MLQRPGCVVFAPIEAAVNEGLYAGASGPENSGYGQGRGGYDYGIFILAGSCSDKTANSGHSGDVDECQYRRERAIDERSVDDDVDVVEVVPKDGYARPSRKGRNPKTEEEVADLDPQASRQKPLR